MTLVLVDCIIFIGDMFNFSNVFLKIIGLLTPYFSTTPELNVPELNVLYELLNRIMSIMRMFFYT